MRQIILPLALLLAATLASAQTKRPMTFEDMMHMKRLGETAVSPDGKWLAYSVTTVDLDKNTRTPELFIQPVAGGGAVKLAVGQPGDDGIQFSPDGKRLLFLSSREGGEQIWLADFDPATGATGNPYPVAPEDSPSTHEHLHRSRQRQLVARLQVHRLHLSCLSRLPANHHRRLHNG